jgi:hypothetical protein
VERDVSARQAFWKRYNHHLNRSSAENTERYSKPIKTQITALTVEINNQNLKRD